MESSMSSVSRLPAGRQLAVGAAAQVLLLAGVAAGPGLGPVGALAGLALAAGSWLVLGAAVRRAGAVSLGPAGLVTLARALLVGAVTALVADGLATGTPATAAVVALAAVALLLDAVDGRVARRTGTATALGARFDMETDAVLLLVLSVHVAVPLGPWVLAIGLMRYAFVAAAAVAPWLGGSLPARLSAKTVAALQGVVLVVAASGLLPIAAAAVLVGAALVLLLWSFGRDVRLLRRASRAADAPAVRIPWPRTPAGARRAVPRPVP
jgi:phosphatidylglycerophosphate synthase